MTLGELQTYVSYLVDDLDFGYFTKPQLTRFLNQSLRETQKLLCLAGENYYVKLSRRLQVANQRDYKLPCNTLYIHRLELWNSGSSPTNPDRKVLGQVTLNQQTAFSTFGEPVAFYLEKDYLILSPAPQNANNYIYLWHSPLVAEMVSESEEPDLPEEFHEYLAHKAAALCFVKDERAMSNISPLVQETEDRLKAAAKERLQSHASKVVTTRGPGIISY